MLRRLTLVQFDLTAHVAPSADIVLWSRLGRGYSPVVLDDLVESGRVIELSGLLRPTEDLALFRAEMAAWPGPPPWRDWQEGLVEWLDANRACHLDVLELLTPGTTAPRPATCSRSWAATA